MFKRLLCFISIVSVLFLMLSVGASALSDCVDLNNLDYFDEAGFYSLDGDERGAYTGTAFSIAIPLVDGTQCSLLFGSLSEPSPGGRLSVTYRNSTWETFSQVKVSKSGISFIMDGSPVSLPYGEVVFEHNGFYGALCKYVTPWDGGDPAGALFQSVLTSSVWELFYDEYSVDVSSGSAANDPGSLHGCFVNAVPELYSSFPSLSDMPWNDSADWTGEVLSVVDETNSLFRFSRDFQLTQDENFSLEGSYLIWGEKDNLVSVPRPLMTLPNWAQSSVNLRFSYRVEYELDGAAKILVLPVDTAGKFYCWLGTSSAGTVEWTEQASVLSFSGSSLSLPSLSSGRLQKIDLDNLADVLGWSGEIKAVRPEISLPDGATVVSEGFSVALNVSLSFYASSADDWISSFPVDQWINYDLVFPDFSGVGSVDVPDDFMASLKDDHDVLLVASVFGQMLSWSLIKSFVLIVLALALVKFIIVG